MRGQIISFFAFVRVQGFLPVATRHTTGSTYHSLSRASRASAALVVVVPRAATLASRFQSQPLLSTRLCLSTRGSSESAEGRGGGRGGRRGRGGRGGRGMNRQRRGGGGRGGRRRRDRSPPPAMPAPGQPGRGCHRDAVALGAVVFVVKKEDQRSGRETSGTVSRLLTNSPYHPRGIKVMLMDGAVGRVTRFRGEELEAVANHNCSGDISSDAEDNNNGGDPSNTRTLADFIQPGGAKTNLQSESSFVVDDAKLATLVSMSFDPEKARQALQFSNNNVEVAVEYLLNVDS